MDRIGEVTAPDGTRYLTPTLAASQLGLEDPRQLDRLIKKGVLSVTTDGGLLGRVTGPGRRPKHLVLATGVEAERDRLLDALGAGDETQRLRSELESVRSSWEQEVLALQSRVQKLEADRESVLTAMRARSRAWAAQVEADSAMLAALDQGTAT